jgi:thiamine-phosphate pyrophosphorylase
VSRPDRIQGLYVILDNTARPDRAHLAICEAALRGGARIIQLRAKTLTKRAFYETAKELRLLTKEHSALFIINDHLDVALASEADGLHLGQEDLPIKAARKIAGERLFIGISTHSLEEAHAAQRAGADYIGFGAIYPTLSKERATAPQGPARLKEVVNAVSIPVVAIGGITQDKVPDLAQTGVAGFAVISAITTAPDMAKEVEGLIRAWRK